MSPASLITIGDESSISQLKTPELWLCRPVNHLKEANHERGENSDYNGPDVLSENMKVWDDFVTAQDILSELSINTLKALKGAFTPMELEKFTWGDPVSGLNINEASFERAWASVTHGINLVLEIVSRRDQDAKDAEYVIIGDGDIAKRKAPEYAEKNFDVKRKKPDYASHQALSADQYQEIGSHNIFNRIPGDAKIYRKIRHSMLPPNGEEFINNQEVRHEAMKVLKQIYNYMDQHEARYGYVVNNEEIVFLRRHPHHWGHMDISPPIKHQVETNLGRGILNSKYVLFYFLHVIAVDESKWRLASCLGEVPTRDLRARGSKTRKLRHTRKIKS